MLENNQVKLMGEITSGFIFSHEVYGEKFYLTKIKVERLSGTTDIILIMVSERIVDINKSYNGRLVEIQGQFRSYNQYEENQNHLVLSIFVREWEVLDKDSNSGKINQIYLEGYVCKPPTYRKTPLGREIADLLVAVNRSYGKSDYIPCITWGKNARFAATFEVGDKIIISGRIQSREYIKKLKEEFEKRTAYEVSISTLQIYGEQQNEKAI